MRRRLSVMSATWGLVALVVASLLLLAPPAHAACHIAGFVEAEVEAQESTGVVSLVVELQGRVGSCAGTVDVTTVDGTAVAGEDYEAVTQTLTFEEDDDRVETVDVTILADEEADGGETFTLELSDPTGDISGTGGPATVTIVDEGGDGDASDPDATDEAEETGAEEPAEDATATDEPDIVLEETAGIDLGIVLAVLGAAVIGVAAFVLLRGRG